ncbi:MAG TPA: hypothetical protein VGN14_04400, partial [Candidatus Elarobacter sp.]
DERTTTIGRQAGAVAQELRSVTRQLEQNGVPSAATAYVERGASLVDGMAQYLQQADSERLVAYLEAFARREPWAIAAGALVAGFAASRFLKAGSMRRYQASRPRSASGTSYGDHQANAYESGERYAP